MAPKTCLFSFGINITLFSFVVNLLIAGKGALSQTGLLFFCGRWTTLRVVAFAVPFHLARFRGMVRLIGYCSWFLWTKWTMWTMWTQWTKYTLVGAVLDWGTA